MRMVERIEEVRGARGLMTGSVGFIPTMGYLHEGHLALVRRARLDNDHVVVSIFVNPSQFGPSEDFEKYPRDVARDLDLLQKEETDLVFAPRAVEIYPEDFSTWVEVEKITERLEGACRPRHFRGVATVVAKLFNIIKPHKAYFGQKDAQQLAVIKKMVAELNMNLEIVSVATVREPDGLAKSSRNSYLGPDERRSALVLWKALNRARGLYNSGELSAERLRQAMIELISEEPAAHIDYVSVADPVSLEELDKVDGPTLVSLAVKIGQTRLIDNIIIGAET